MGPTPGRRGWALAVAAVAAAVAFHLRAALFRGQVLYERDLHLQWYGQVESLLRCLRAGSWPLWDPWVAFGQPLLANANNQLLYPFTWLHLLLLPWTYCTVFTAAHLVGAGVGAFALAAALGASFEGALAAGLLFTLCGPLLSLGNLWNHLAAAAWMPWVLLAAHRLGASPGRGRALAAGAALCALVLTGSPDLTAFTLALGVALALAAAPPAGGWRRALAWGAAAAALGLALPGAQLLPSLQLAAQSGHLSLGPGARAFWATHPLVLAQAVVPLTFDAVPLQEGLRQRLLESREPLLLSLFCGLPTLALALSASPAPRRERRLLLGAALVFAVYALGARTPLYGLAVEALPGLAALRFPSKALVPAALCLCVAAGAGYDAWARRRSLRTAAVLLLAALTAGGLAVAVLRPGPALAAAVVPPPGQAAADALRPLAHALLLTAATALVLAAAAGWGGRPWTARGTLLLGIGLLAWRGEGVNPTAPPAFFTTRPPVLAAVHQEDQRRLYVWDYLLEYGRAERDLHRVDAYRPVLMSAAAPFPWAGALALRFYLLPPIGAGFGVLDSYSADGLGIQDQGVRLLQQLVLATEGTPLHTRLLQLGAVSQVLTLHERGVGALRPEAVLPGPFAEPLRVWGVPDPRPRAYLVTGVRVASGPDAWRALADPGFDPAREVVLSAGTPRPPSADPAGTVTVARLVPDAVDLDVDASGPAHVVLVDAFDPGWSAAVDGTPAPVLRANTAFRAVAVPAGRHQVCLTYRPPVVAWGAAVSVLALGVLLAGSVRPRPGRRL